jgi:hypothetical protein
MKMKMITVLPATVIAFALLGCAQQASNAPAAARPDATPPAASTTNTFGESSDQTASNAAKARDAQYGSSGSDSGK